VSAWLGSRWSARAKEGVMTERVTKEYSRLGPYALLHFFVFRQGITFQVTPKVVLAKSNERDAAQKLLRTRCARSTRYT
jgi:hypothetical protein